jgi:hypothetical protein
MSSRVYLHLRVQMVYAEICGKVTLNKEVLLQAFGKGRQTQERRLLTHGFKTF